MEPLVPEEIHSDVEMSAPVTKSSKRKTILLRSQPLTASKLLNSPTKPTPTLPTLPMDPDSLTQAEPPSTVPTARPALPLIPAPKGSMRINNSREFYPKSEKSSKGYNGPRTTQLTEIEFLTLYYSVMEIVLRMCEKKKTWAAHDAKQQQKIIDACVARHWWLAAYDHVWIVSDMATVILSTAKSQEKEAAFLGQCMEDFLPIFLDSSRKQFPADEKIPQHPSWRGNKPQQKFSRLPELQYIDLVVSVFAAVAEECDTEKTWDHTDNLKNHLKVERKLLDKHPWLLLFDYVWIVPHLATLRLYKTVLRAWPKELRRSQKEEVPDFVPQWLPKLDMSEYVHQGAKSTSKTSRKNQSKSDDKKTNDEELVDVLRKLVEDEEQVYWAAFQAAMPSRPKTQLEVEQIIRSVWEMTNSHRSENSSTWSTHTQSTGLLRVGFRAHYWARLKVVGYGYDWIDIDKELESQP